MRSYITLILIIILNAYSLSNINYINNSFNKQLTWIILEILIYIFANKIDKHIIYKNIFKIYLIFNVLLLYVLLFGNAINGSKAWINFASFSLQPSEFMKMILIILLNMIPFIYDKYHLKNTILVLIPSILTFLEPDTGNVIFYLLIIIIVFLLHEKQKNIIKLVISCFMISFFILFMYLNYKQIFIDLFGVYRINRIETLLNKESYQLNMSLISIGSAGLYGSKNLIKVPFFETDFAFCLLTSLHGFIGSVIYLLINMLLNIVILIHSQKVPKLERNIIITFLLVKIVQESINILMTIGIVPITGITLPLVSYGGSSLMIYAFMLGLINNNSYYMDKQGKVA